MAPAYCVEPAREVARVAEPDHVRTWETVLRAPFRVVFYPVRLVARGTEQVVAFGSRYVVKPHGRLEWLGLVFALVSVWAAEALNTACELVCDVACPTFHPLVARAKDVAASAVLICATGALATALIVFVPLLA